jgi:hypothetical protein
MPGVPPFDTYKQSRNPSVKSQNSRMLQDDVRKTITQLRKIADELEAKLPRDAEPVALNPSKQDEPTKRPGDRPGFYPHPLQARADTIDVHAGDRTDVMELLKLKNFEGVYNLSVLLLVFALFYMMVRNVKQYGLHLTISDFTCPEQRRDVLFSAQVQSSHAYTCILTNVSGGVCVCPCVRPHVRPCGRMLTVCRSSAQRALARC